MANLINSTSELQEYISVSGSLDFDLVLPYVKKAERKYLEPIFTKTELQNIITATEGIKKDVQEILSDASANFALLLALPVIAVDFSNIGLTVSNNESIKQAEWWQVKDLKRSLADSAYSSIDETLILMEANADDFSDWKSSESYTVFKELLVNRTDIFDKYFPIKKSRRTFLALKHFIEEVQDEYVLAPLGTATLDLLLGDSDKVNVKQVKKLLQKGIVAMTIAKVADTATFELTDTGLFYRWEELPGEKTKLVPDKNLQRLREQKETAADNYFRQALKIIMDNPADFPDYSIPETNYELPVQKFDSGLGL